MVTVAAIQMVSTTDLHHNLDTTAELIASAVTQGAEFLVLPENFAFMGKQESDKLTVMESFGSGIIQDFLAQQSQQHKIWLVAGTIPLQATVANKARAACLLYDPHGQCRSRYDKVHLFDVTVDQAGEENYQESDTLEAGKDIVVFAAPFGNIGMSVCYDLRFPELYRAMHKKGVNMITVPSAFTATTGQAHWKSLLRSRAIENLCYVIASNQGGQHSNQRSTWGHSMIIDPWGRILDNIKQQKGYVIADIDTEKQKKLRRSFPCLEHRVFT